MCSSVSISAMVFSLSILNSLSAAHSAPANPGLDSLEVGRVPLCRLTFFPDRQLLVDVSQQQQHGFSIFLC